MRPAAGQGDATCGHALVPGTATPRAPGEAARDFASGAGASGRPGASWDSAWRCQVRWRSPQRLHWLRRGDRCWQGFLGRKFSPALGTGQPDLWARQLLPGVFLRVWLTLRTQATRCRVAPAAGSGLGSGGATGTLPGAEDGAWQRPGARRPVGVSRGGENAPVPAKHRLSKSTADPFPSSVPEALVWLQP